LPAVPAVARGGPTRRVAGFARFCAFGLVGAGSAGRGVRHLVSTARALRQLVKPRADRTAVDQPSAPSIQPRGATRGVSLIPTSSLWFTHPHWAWTRPPATDTVNGRGQRTRTRARSRARVTVTDPDTVAVNGHGQGSRTRTRSTDPGHGQRTRSRARSRTRTRSTVTVTGEGEGMVTDTDTVNGHGSADGQASYGRGHGMGVSLGASRCPRRTSSARQSAHRSYSPSVVSTVPRASCIKQP
jgi:hypothetical protein